MNKNALILVVAAGILLVLLCFGRHCLNERLHRDDQKLTTNYGQQTALPSEHAAPGKLAAEKPQIEYPMGSEEAYNELLKKVQTLTHKSFQDDLQARRELVAISQDPKLDVVTRTYVEAVVKQGTLPPPSKWEAVVKKAALGNEQASRDIRAMAINDGASKDDRQLAIAYLARDGKIESLIVVFQLVLSQNKDIRFWACSALPKELVPYPVSRYSEPTEETKTVVNQLTARVRQGWLEWNQTEVKWQKH